MIMKIHGASRKFTFSPGYPEKSFLRRKNWTAIFLALVLLAGTLVIPAMAETKLMTGEPSVTAAVYGKNEFSPGENATLTLIIQNTGVNQWKFVNSKIENAADQPSTAKLLQVTLHEGDAPLTIQSNSQIIGALKASDFAFVTFDTKIANNAPAGIYNLPLNMNYTYIWTADQYSQNTIHSYYRPVNMTISLPIKIKPVMKIAVPSAVPDHVNAGNEGYIHIQVKNIGCEPGNQTILQIAQSGTSPITPTESSEYIGDFLPNATINATFKIRVSEDAHAQTYPLDVFTTYVNSEGDTVNSDLVTVGIPVGEKMDFVIRSPTETLAPGETKTVSVIFQNTGNTTAYSAKARLSMTPPFTSTNNQAYLGDLAPGETATANFIVSVDKQGVQKEYGLDTEVQYRDALDNDIVSDTIKVDINVASKTGIEAITSSPIDLTIIAGVLVGIAYVVIQLIRRKG